MMPVLCKIGPFSIYSYGFLSAVALGLAATMAARHAARFGYQTARAVDAVFLLFIAGMAGARLFFVFQHADYYRSSPMHLFNFREGGLVWYGGFLAAFAAGFALTRSFGWKRWAFADFISPIAAAAHAVGRIGCFLNGCCGGVDGHPVQLYEAGFLAVLAGFLWIKTGHTRKEGDLFLLYVLLYTAGRFFLEFLRAEQVRYGIFSIPQMTGAVLFALAASAWVVRHHDSRNF